MKLSASLKFYRYAWAWENYLLLARTAQAAFFVRRRVHDRAVTPRLSAALPVINECYLPPQFGWRVSDAEKIARFASFAVNFPVRWGRCLQRSLIIYRLLNAYGLPAQLRIGIDRNDARADGHVWVVKLADGGAFAEAAEPQERYQTIFASPLP